MEREEREMTVPELSNLCVCCLSENTSKARSLRKYTAIIRDSLSLKIHSATDKCIVCKDCASLLKKLKQFRNKVISAQKFIKGMIGIKGRHASAKLDKVRKNLENVQTTNAVEDTSSLPTKVASITAELGLDTMEITSAVEQASNPSTKGETMTLELAKFSADAYIDGIEVCSSASAREENADFDTSKPENSQSEPGQSDEPYNFYAPNPDEPKTHMGKKRSCPTCKKQFVFYKELLDHMPTHGSRYTCEVCGKRCSTRVSLNGHRSTHDPPAHSCTACGNVYKRSSTLRDHVRSAHDGEKKSYKCSECSEVFATFHGRLVHLIMAHGHEEKRYRCDECPKKYNHGSHLRAHIRNQHRMIKNVKCERCHYTFFNTSALKKHMVSHSSERNYQCGHCSKKYPRRSALNQHLKIHNNVKEFVCSVCSRAFTQKVTLNKHALTHGRSDRTDEAERTGKSDDTQETMNSLSCMLQNL